MATMIIGAEDGTDPVYHDSLQGPEFSYVFYQAEGLVPGEAYIVVLHFSGARMARIALRHACTGLPHPAGAGMPVRMSRACAWGGAVLSLDALRRAVLCCSGRTRLQRHRKQRA